MTQSRSLRSSVVLLTFLALMVAGCFGPSRPAASTLERVYVEKYSAAVSSPLEVEKVEVLGYEGKWAKARLTAFGETSSEYFYWEGGDWHVANLVGGMTPGTAKRLGVPESLWRSDH